MKMLKIAILGSNTSENNVFVMPKNGTFSRLAKIQFEACFCSSPNKDRQLLRNPKTDPESIRQKLSCTKSEREPESVKVCRVCGYARVYYVLLITDSPRKRLYR